MDELPMGVRIEVLSHAIRLVFWTMARNNDWSEDQTNDVITTWVENLRSQTFPTNDPNFSMFVADEFAEEFERVLRKS